MSKKVSKTIKKIELEADYIEVLSRIFIRVPDVTGRWGTYSLRDLIGARNARAIREWFVDFLMHAAFELNPGDVLTEDHVAGFIKFLDFVGLPPVRLKKDDADSN